MQPYNSSTYFLKYLNRQVFLKYIFQKAISYCLILIITCNLSKFKKTNGVFVNSYAFGHSVTETSIFFHQYGYRGVCLSVGNRNNRNKYVKNLFEPYLLLHFWLPNINDINIYHALRLRVHNAIDLSFRKSRLIKILLKRKLVIVSRDVLLNDAAVKSLQKDYHFSSEDSTRIVKKFDSVYSKSQSETSISSLHYLVQQKSLVDYSLSKNLLRFNNKFLKKAEIIAKKNSYSEIKICTIVLRRSWKPWSGLGLDSYSQVFEYLESRNYLINLIGDVGEFYELKTAKKFNVLNSCFEYNLNPKIFQILSIINSDFCIGDQSGLQALIHFLNKRNFIINSVPFGQLQYNSVVLPRIWANENGLKTGAEEHFSTLMYRYHPIKKANSSVIYPQYYSPETVLDAVKNFVETNELNQNSLELDLKGFTNLDPECMALFSKNTSYSPVLFKELKF